MTAAANTRSTPLPATLIAGFGAAGRARVIAALLRQKPAHEEWAVIAAAGDGQMVPAGPWVEHVAPGCPCCTGLTPFSTGLTRLLRRLQGARASRLLIEGGPEGHIASIARLLEGVQLRPHVRLAGSVAVINPLWIAHPTATAGDALRRLADEAGALIAGAWDEADAAARAAFAGFAASFSPPRSWVPMDDVTPAFVFAAPRGNDGA